METSKIKKGKNKTTYFFFFILNLSKWKRFLQFWSSNMHLSSIQMLEKIIDKGSFPKVWNNNLWLWLSYDWLLSLSNFNLLESHIAQFHIGFKKRFFFKVFIFLRIQCAKLKMCKWICVNTRHLNRRNVKFRK